MPIADKFAEKFSCQMLKRLF